MPQSHVWCVTFALIQQEVHPGVCAECVRRELHAGRSEADREAA